MILVEKCGYLLKEKSNAFEMFKKFKEVVENGTEKSINMLRTDPSGEFCSKEFTLYCEKVDIERKYTTPYTLQQNGVVERRNRTVAATITIHVEGSRPACCVCPKSFTNTCIEW